MAAGDICINETKKIESFKTWEGAIASTGGGKLMSTK